MDSADRSPLARYLKDGFAGVRGMSSLFAARICSHLIARQTQLGISGQIAEIGAFEGRFFIAMAHGLAPGEHGLAIDVFDWPDDGVEARFRANCAAHGVAPDSVTVFKGNTGALDVPAFSALLKGQPARFIHIDGDHSHDALTKDLALALATLHPSGLICLDDMLHPAYPFLVVTVQQFLVAHPELRLVAIIDREDIVGAAKFLICRADAVPLYENDLMESFAPAHFVLGGDALGHHCVVLTPEPRLADVG